MYNNTTKTGKFGFKFQGLLVDIHFSKKQILHLDNIRASLQKQSSSNNNNNNNIGITSELHAKVHGISEWFSLKQNKNNNNSGLSQSSNEPTKQPNNQTTEQPSHT